MVAVMVKFLQTALEQLLKNDKKTNMRTSRAVASAASPWVEVEQESAA